jgi:hypothetical protein
MSIYVYTIFLKKHNFKNNGVVGCSMLYSVALGGFPAPQVGFR